jgi:hypothetical protein
MDRIDCSDWPIEKTEQRGSNPKKFWLIVPGKLSRTRSRALFKNDRDHAAGERELKFFNLCQHFAVHCSKVELARRRDYYGHLSYDNAIPGLISKEAKDNINSLLLPHTTHIKECNWTVELIAKHFSKTLLLGLVKMLLIDTLTCHEDRQESNWAIMRDKKNVPVRIAPLFDNEHTFSVRTNISKVVWQILPDGTYIFLTYDELWYKLRKLYPRWHSEFVNKISTLGPLKDEWLTHRIQYLRKTDKIP